MSPRLAGALALFAAAALAPLQAHAIQGCTLRDPDRDVRRLFPEATDFKSHFVTLAERDAALHRTLGERLGDALDPVYEAADLPYAYYEVLEGSQVIGYVFGVNQKGKYGGIQLILAADPRGTIRDFYFQKLSSPDRAAFSAPAFTDQFKGLTLADFYYHQGYVRLGRPNAKDKVARIAPPADSETARQDFAATLRGVMKDLILLDLLWLDDRHGPVFEQVREIVREKGVRK